MEPITDREMLYGCKEGIGVLSTMCMLMAETIWGNGPETVQMLQMSNEARKAVCLPRIALEDVQTKPSS